jgi:hypothetical protein
MEMDEGRVSRHYHRVVRRDLPKAGVVFDHIFFKYNTGTFYNGLFDNVFKKTKELIWLAFDHIESVIKK